MCAVDGQRRVHRARHTLLTTWRQRVEVPLALTDVLTLSAAQHAASNSSGSASIGIIFIDCWAPAFQPEIFHSLSH